MSSSTVRSHGTHVRIAYASVGSTDATAWRGDYLLQPFPAFVSGYDFVGTVEKIDQVGRAQGLSIGQRVAGVLPRMGAHASVISAPASLLVPLPDGLSSLSAATLPLDALTAFHALQLLRPGARSVLIQGVGGSVGTLAAQLAQRKGLTVIGTASTKSLEQASRYASDVYDYNDREWQVRLVTQHGLVDGIVDHTGDPHLRHLVAPDGRIIRTAFGGPVGHQKVATFIGMLRSVARSGNRPSERICSIPLLVATRRTHYRQALSKLFSLARNGSIHPPEPQVFSACNIQAALHEAQGGIPGRKILLKL